MQSIVHIKRILSELANVQCSPSLHCQTQGRRLTFHGDIRPSSSPPFEFIPPSCPAPLHTVLKFREIEKGERGRGRRNGEKKFEGWRSGVTRGDGNRNSVRGRRGRARETVLLLVFICGATEISALQLTRTISGKIFQRLSTSARVHAASSNAPQRALPQDFHPCQTYATSVFSIRTYSLAFLFFLLLLFSLSSPILSRGNSNLPLFSPFLLFSFRDSTPDFDFDFSNKQRRKMKSAPTIGD